MFAYHIVRHISKNMRLAKRALPLWVNKHLDGGFALFCIVNLSDS